MFWLTRRTRRSPLEPVVTPWRLIYPGGVCVAVPGPLSTPRRIFRIRSTWSPGRTARHAAGSGGGSMRGMCDMDAPSWERYTNRDGFSGGRCGLPARRRAGANRSATTRCGGRPTSSKCCPGGGRTAPPSRCGRSSIRRRPRCGSVSWRRPSSCGRRAVRSGWPHWNGCGWAISARA